MVGGSMARGVKIILLAAAFNLIAATHFHRSAIFDG